MDGYKPRFALQIDKVSGRVNGIKLSILRLPIGGLFIVSCLKPEYKPRFVFQTDKVSGTSLPLS